MKSYAEREVFTEAAVSVWRRATLLVERIAAYKAEGQEIRWHELARALGRIFALDVVDGASVGVDHSWLVVDRTTLLDPYVPGRLPMVQLVDIGTPTLLRFCYAPERDGKPRQDIREDVVARLTEQMRAPDYGRRSDRGHDGYTG